MKQCILMVLAVALAPPSSSHAGQAGALVNPGFESSSPLDGWQVVTYGAKAAVALDGREVREGAWSVRVSAETASDTALGQDLSLQPGQWYRFTGWVKTRGLDPLGAPVSGTFQVQRSTAAALIAGGPSHSGDTALEPGRAGLPGTRPTAASGSPRFWSGYGKGRGTAWFDDMAIEPVDPTRAPVVITREPLQSGPDQPVPVRPVHRIPVHARAVDVGREAL